MSEKPSLLKCKHHLCIFLGLIILCASPGSAQENLRAWHVQGQTFLLWQHTFADPLQTFSIYSSSQPILSLDDATLVGQVYSGNGSNDRLHSFLPDMRWKLPDTTGGTVTVQADESYFVNTPAAPGISYFAVIPSGGSLISSKNTTGPVTETVDPADVVVQYEDDRVTIFGHWIDGREYLQAGRSEYPPMGNRYANGLGYNFALWHPADQTFEKAPLVVCLHPMYTDLFLWSPVGLIGKDYTGITEGYAVCFDDQVQIDGITQPGYINTFWIGYHSEYNRFAPNAPSDSATVVNYTWQRIWWELDRVIQSTPIDTTRISITGMSMGGFGTLAYTQLEPDFFSAGLSFVPPTNFWFMSSRLVGTSRQNLPTPFPGQPGIYDIYDWRWRLDHLGMEKSELPFTTIVCGKEDFFVGWNDKPMFYTVTDTTGTGYHLYWDTRGHMIWSDSHFQFSEHLHASYLTRFRSDRSYPAFFHTDTDPSRPERNPYPGNGNRDNGDPWGTWGGYLEWDTEMITDTTGLWAVTVWVTDTSAYPHDIPETDTILAHVTPHRLQDFEPQGNQYYYWSCTDTADHGSMQKGVVETSSNGEIIIKHLKLTKKASRLEIYGPSSKGDVNSDGMVNVLDVVETVNIILEINRLPSTYQRWASDWNDDGDIDIEDLLAIIETLL